jgi:hypothetical protein
VYGAHYFMLIVAPAGELGQIVIYPLVVGVKDMRAILVDKQPFFIITVICIAANVVPLF